MPKDLASAAHSLWDVAAKLQKIAPTLIQLQLLPLALVVQQFARQIANTFVEKKDKNLEYQENYSSKFSQILQEMDIFQNENNDETQENEQDDNKQNPSNEDDGSDNEENKDQKKMKKLIGYLNKCLV